MVSFNSDYLIASNNIILEGVALKGSKKQAYSCIWRTYREMSNNQPIFQSSNISGSTNSSESDSEETNSPVDNSDTNITETGPGDGDSEDFEESESTSTETDDY
jgi:hypothetical protein